jgi:hypothetical protein
MKIAPSNDYDRRKANGRAAIASVGTDLAELDTETAASDAVANILTALFGAAGAFDTHGSLISDPLAEVHAAKFLTRALGSWRGDAEDYEMQNGNTRAADDDLAGGRNTITRRADSDEATPFVEDFPA